MDPLERIFGKTAQMIVLKNLIEKQNEPTYLSGIAARNGIISLQCIKGYHTFGLGRRCSRKTSGKANPNFPAKHGK